MWGTGRVAFLAGTVAPAKKANSVNESWKTCPSPVGGV